MRFVTQQRTLAGLGALVVFGAFFVLPLYAALSICTMPCCGHESDAAEMVVGAGAPACATECGIRSTDATPQAVATVATQNESHRAAPLVVAVVRLPEARGAHVSLEHDTGPAHRGAYAPLHVLNSVFRI